jgi:hypothetical protein
MVLGAAVAGAVVAGGLTSAVASTQGPKAEVIGDLFICVNNSSKLMTQVWSTTVCPTGSYKYVVPKAPAVAAGAVGVQGVPGPKGATGADGAPGQNANYTGAHWGVVHRNVMGNGDAELASSTVAPPLGVGALNVRTGGSGDKAAFGNETDFLGQRVSDLTAIGYSVFTTGENNALAPNNMPSITFEIDPNVTASDNYASLVYAPDNSTANAWTSIDAKADTGKHWGLTGSFFNAEPDRCGLNGSRCTFAEVLAYLTTNNDAAQGDATMFTAQITKGRDYAFSGAVDALVINDTTFNFEPLGVYATK